MPRSAVLFALGNGMVIGSTAPLFMLALALGDYGFAFFFWFVGSWAAWLLARQPPLNGRAYRG